MASGPRADQEHHCCQSRRKPVQRKKNLGNLPRKSVAIKERGLHSQLQHAIREKRIRDWISPKEWCCVGLLHNRTRLAAADGLPCPETIMGAHGAASNHREQKNQFIFVYTSNEYIFLLTSTQIQILVQNCAQRDRQLEKWGLVPNAVPHYNGGPRCCVQPSWANSFSSKTDKHCHSNMIKFLPKYFKVMQCRSWGASSTTGWIFVLILAAASINDMWNVDTLLLFHLFLFYIIITYTFVRTAHCVEG